MGANLARNMANHGFRVVGYDLDGSKMHAFAVQPHERCAVADTPAGLLEMLERPRRLLIMVPAGPAVDRVIDQLRPHLDAGDVLIDGGNSFFRDTDRRAAELGAAGLLFLGVGISGGEEGALHGPSMMAGGARIAWDEVSPILTAIAAKADDGDPCVAFMGARGAGHYVKMVHNGLEYGDMQLIAEAYDLLRRCAGCSARDLAGIFRSWNEGELESYLIEITARVLDQTDDTGLPLVELIVDEAQQRGTGKWMSQEALDLGVPVPTVTAAVEARMLSTFKDERVAASRILRGPDPVSVGSHAAGRAALVDAARDALYASRIALYAQGMALLRRASDEYGYAIDLAGVARVWRAGCILRAARLSDIQAAFERDAGLVNLMLDGTFCDALAVRQTAWRDVVQTATQRGIPMPATSASLAYYDGYRSAVGPANLIQAQRDLFGAHTYRRVDREGSFHANWTRPFSETRV